MASQDPTKHIEVDSFKYFVMDEKNQRLPREKVLAFTRHMAECVACRKEYEKAKLEVAHLDHILKGESVSLPPESAYLKEKEFVHQTFLRVKAETSQSEPAEVQDTIELPNVAWSFNTKGLAYGVLAVLALAFLGFGAYLVLYRTHEPEFSNRPSNNADEANVGARPELAEGNRQDSPPTSVDSSSENNTRTGEVEKPTLLALNDSNGPVSLTADGEITGLADYGHEIRSKISRTLGRGASEYPKLTDIEFVRITQMGNDTALKPFSVQPNGTVLRSSRPTFSWEEYEGADSYEIRVFDIVDNYREVAAEQSIKQTRWSPSVPLHRGRAYSWELRVVQNGETKKIPEKSQIRFKIIDRLTDNEIRIAEKVKPKSHLALGVMYARAGLFADAEQEFQKLVKLNPNSEKARELLNGVQSRLRR